MIPLPHLQTESSPISLIHMLLLENKTYVNPDRTKHQHQPSLLSAWREVDASYLSAGTDIAMLELDVQLRHGIT